MSTKRKSAFSTYSNLNQNEKGKETGKSFCDYKIKNKKVNNIKKKRLRKGILKTNKTIKHSKYNSCCDHQIEHNDTHKTKLNDSKKEALNLFSNIIAPITYEKFFNNYWEKTPLLIKRNKPDFYKDWFSCSELEKILIKNDLEFTKNIDITSYVNGIKENHNPDGKAYAPIVWDFFQQGCSIRLLNPQSYSENVWRYLSSLEQLFLTSVGANVYLTPAGTQGFAPHYDDIEAFVLQLEGKKHWKVYAPRNENESYPLFSSRNFSQDEIGESIIDCILEKGDLLYFPRGYIHQANACDDIHSLHITVSCFQKTTYGDFLSKVIAAGVEIAMEENKELRKNLPIGYLDFGGFSYNKVKDRQREHFIEKIIKMSKIVIENYLPIDSALDQFGKKFLQESLKPYLNKNERLRSIHGGGEKWNSIKQQVNCISELEPFTHVRLIKRNCIRLVDDENGLLLYHNMENSRLFQDKELKFLEVDENAISTIIFLINSYPKYVSIDELPMADIDKKISVASCLYEKGLLVSKEKLDYAFQDEFSDSLEN